MQKGELDIASMLYIFYSDVLLQYIFLQQVVTRMVQNTDTTKYKLTLDLRASNTTRVKRFVNFKQQTL